jgi:hypothetical protein
MRINDMFKFFYVEIETATILNDGISDYWMQD